MAAAAAAATTDTSKKRKLDQKEQTTAKDNKEPLQKWKVSQYGYCSNDVRLYKSEWYFVANTKTQLMRRLLVEQHKTDDSELKTFDEIMSCLFSVEPEDAEHILNGCEDEKIHTQWKHDRFHKTPIEFIGLLNDDAIRSLWELIYDTDDDSSSDLEYVTIDEWVEPTWIDATNSPTLKKITKNDINVDPKCREPDCVLKYCSPHCTHYVTLTFENPRRRIMSGHYIAALYEKHKLKVPEHFLWFTKEYKDIKIEIDETKCLSNSDDPDDFCSHTVTIGTNPPVVMKSNRIRDLLHATTRPIPDHFFS